MRSLLACLCLILSAAMLGCDDGGAATSPPHAGGPTSRQYPFHAVCTVGMVTDIVREVAGDKANVTGIIGEGVDPHLYKPTRNDVAALLEADVVFYSGLMLEGKMADTLVKIARDGKSVFAVTELIDEDFLLQPPEFQGHHDPHVWMSVTGWMKAVEAVIQSLGAYDPPNAETYAANGKRYLAALKALDDYARQSIASIPESSRILVTAHDAFGYFGRDYKIRVEGIQGISTESEAGLQRINQLVDLLVKQKVQAVFAETSVADKNMSALVEGAAARGASIRIGGRLFSDAMGAPGTYEGTYIGMIDHNVTIITRALGGTAPERGMNGKLAVTR